MPTQRPYFLSSFLSAFRQQGTSLPPSQQANKHTTQAGSASSVSVAAANSSSSPVYPSQSSTPSSTSRTASTVAAAAAAAAAAVTPSPHAYGRSPPAGVSIHSRGPITSANGIPIPDPSSGRRRGSDSSSEGFRDRLGADKWYIGGRTATGEERFFKLGVVKRVRSNDGLSLDRLSL